MKKALFAIMVSSIFATPALAVGTNTVTNVVHNTVNAVNSVVGGGTSLSGGGSASVGVGGSGGTGASVGPISISTGGSAPGPGMPPATSGGQNGAPTDGFYLGAQSDGNGFVSIQITKTLFRF